MTANVVDLPKSPISSPPHASICNKDVVNLCFENNNFFISPIFEKHTIGIGSRLLNKIKYTRGGLGKNGHSIVDPIVPMMFTPRIVLGYDSIVSSLTTPKLATNMEVLFISSGVHMDFPTKQSPKLIDEVVVPEIPNSKNIFFDDVVVDILGYTLESTLNYELISLDQPTHTFVPYRHPFH
jgi:hypothetical protein